MHPNTDSKLLGESAEDFALKLLHSRGYTAARMPVNNPTYDLSVQASASFCVSVKASRTKQHVRLGSLESVRRLAPGHFVFGFMPQKAAREIRMEEGGYRLFIVPAEIARDDSIAVRTSYLEYKGYTESYNYSLMVKGYSRRPHNVEIWAKWAQFEDAWHLLPRP